MTAHERHVKWNEGELAEHDKTRGTRQVIDQPDTPYIYYDSDAEEVVKAADPSAPGGMQSMDLGYLRQRLGVAKVLQEAEEEIDHADLQEQADAPISKTLFEMRVKAFQDEQAQSLLNILSGVGVPVDDDDDGDDDEPGAHHASERHSHHSHRHHSHTDERKNMDKKAKERRASRQSSSTGTPSGQKQKKSSSATSSSYVPSYSGAYKRC